MVAIVISVFSPIFAYRVGLTTIGRINLFTVLLFIGSWLFILTMGLLYNHPVSMLFYVSIMANCCFAIGNSVWFMHKRNPKASVKKLLVVLSFLTALCFVFIELMYPTNVLIDTLLQTVMLTVPLFVCGVIWVRFRQIDREPEHT
ncbi:hypothetical protein [Exiguobacterium aurantiacum]|uniref:hypothetical protein n=1 Tax=Exiguobacterium aurantiacum TaxID=33987 RepID=UPI00384E2538